RKPVLFSRVRHIRSGSSQRQCQLCCSCSERWVVWNGPQTEDGKRMADVFLPVKNLIVEWRYQPQLGFYSKMDGVGLHFHDEFPDWQRSALSLEILNKTANRRFFMAYRRAFYDVVGIADHSVRTELEVARPLFERLGDQLGIERLDRIGFRQWAAF